MITNDFYQQFATLKYKPTLLPYIIGGATRFGDLKNFGMNQDALGIDVENNYISAVVSDGCSSSFQNSKSLYSCNEVASRLSTVFILNAIRQVIRRNGIDVIMSPKEVSSLIFSTYINSLYKCSIWEGRGVKSREQIMFNYLMATALFFIVSKDYYVICSFGDGVIATNHQLTLLKEEAGNYPANFLIQKINQNVNATQHTTSFRVIESGKTAGLSYIYLASDGLYKLFEMQYERLKHFIDIDNKNGIYGFDQYFLKHFRKEIVYPLYASSFSTIINAPDDQTIICLHRQK